MLKHKLLTRHVREQIIGYLKTKQAWLDTVEARRIELAGMGIERSSADIATSDRQCLELYESHLNMKACIDTELELVLEVLNQVIASESMPSIERRNSASSGSKFRATTKTRKVA